MTITLRPAHADDYAFALNLYIEAVRPLASAWIDWVEADQKAQFASLWRPDDTWIITLNGQEIGWVEFRQTGDETFLKQLYVAPLHQRRGIGSQVMRRLNEQGRTAKSMALFVLKNNPAFRFYKRHGFEVVQETHSTFVMRRKLDRAA
jgi:ribosomal protein S18 acetylase RimI-like enzyme